MSTPSLLERVTRVLDRHLERTEKAGLCLAFRNNGGMLTGANEESAAFLSELHEMASRLFAARDHGDPSLGAARACEQVLADNDLVHVVI
jgi:hypothetical protein